MAEVARNGSPVRYRCAPFFTTRRTPARLVQPFSAGRQSAYVAHCRQDCSAENSAVTAVGGWLVMIRSLWKDRCAGWTARGGTVVGERDGDKTFSSRWTRLLPDAEHSPALL